MNKPSSSTKGRGAPPKDAATPRSPSRPKREGSPLGELDQHLFNEGTHPHIYRFLGAHPGHYQGKDGTWFGVWAPSAREVKVIGDFSGWQDGPVLYPQGASGIWHGFVPDVGQGELYKYKITPQHGHAALEKADPLGFHFEVPPRQASVVWKLEGYQWNDEAWMKERGRRNALDAPMSIYEVHLGSFMRVPEEGDRYLNYREAAVKLADRVELLGFTHVELLPVMEHPFYGSWGYQVTGYFAPSSRYGTPQDLMYMIDYLHQRGIGVILDWVPAHFPSDAHGLAQFDGSHIYEHADPRQGFHPDWKSMIFNYGRHEVRSFLVSSALFWLDKFHVDGLRVDGVASMLYLDYSREAGEWIPNEYGGRENLGAIQLLRSLNETVYKEFPDVQTIAEESTAWPMVSRPVWAGGLGFGLKWDMGWMHDTLQYMHRESIHRRWHHGELTFRGVYAFQENFVLPLSHDEVVHGKGSLLDKMPGDDWQKFANLRLLYAYMFATPGKKLLFMGSEFGQWSEWKHDQSLDWHLEESPLHRGVRDLVGHLARTYAAVPALHALDTDPSGFEWIDANDSENSVVSFLRWDPERQAPVVVVFNFTPVPRQNYRIGVPSAGYWREVVNTDAAEFGGSGQGNLGGAEAHPAACHGRQWSLNLTLPPLGAIWLQL